MRHSEHVALLYYVIRLPARGCLMPWDTFDLVRYRLLQHVERSAPMERLPAICALSATSFIVVYSFRYNVIRSMRLPKIAECLFVCVGARACVRLGVCAFGRACVRACLCVCAHFCVCACVCVHVCARVRSCVRVCVRLCYLCGFKSSTNKPKQTEHFRWPTSA